MHIFLKKFGTTLVSRPAGKEAFMAFQPSLKNIKEDETVEMDFEGVDVLTPSWADEFITPLRKQYGARLSFLNTENLSVKTTLETLEKQSGK